MESSTITIDIPKKYSDLMSSQLILPIECNIWAYIDNSTNKTTHTKDIFTQHAMGNIPKTFTDTFGMIYSCESTDTSWNDYTEQCLMNQILSNAVLDEHQLHTVHSIISKEDFQLFIDHVCNRSVEFTSAAAYLIKGYYVASRRVRSCGIHGTALPQTAIRTIACMASGHSKLSLRDKVIEEDAVMAIMIYEESMTARYGYSVLSVQPTPHFKDDNLSMYIGKENDLRMHQFKIQLTRFCLSHAAEIRSGFTEE
ncbi:minichromosome maintenance domain-containing protein 2-like [Glandiceps talaboti]